MSNTRLEIDRSGWPEPLQERTYRAFPPTDFYMEPNKFLREKGFKEFPFNRSLVFPTSYGERIWYNTKPVSSPIEFREPVIQLYVFGTERGPVFLAYDADYLTYMRDRFTSYNPHHREFHVFGSPKGIEEMIEKAFAGVRIIEPTTPTLRRIPLY